MPAQYIGKYVDGGSQNSFYRVKRTKHGFKGFPNQSLAAFAHKVQSTLATNNLAPRVYSPVCRIRVPNYFMGQGGVITQMVLSDWGYLTEIAKPYSCIDPNCEGDCAYDGCCHNSRVISELLTILENDYGIDYIDAHPANLGYIVRDGKDILVPIDLGAESLSDINGAYPEVCWDGADDIECCCEECRKKYSYA